MSASTDGRYLGIALLLIVGFMVFEVIMGLTAGSLALLADAGHMLTDALALTLSLSAARLALRPARGALTFGFRRVEVLSAQANGVTLVLVSGVITVESVRRLIHPPAVHGLALVVVAGVGVVINLVATLVLARADRTSINVEGSFQHLVTDLYAFIATVIAGGVILATGFRRADAIASLVVVVLMLRAAWGLLRETTMILLEATPKGIAPAEVKATLASHPAVESVHDVHVWLISSGFPALSAHILVRPQADCHAVRIDLEQLLQDRHNIDHTTLQVDHTGEELLQITSGAP